MNKPIDNTRNTSEQLENNSQAITTTLETSVVEEGSNENKFGIQTGTVADRTKFFENANASVSKMKVSSENNKSKLVKGQKEEQDQFYQQSSQTNIRKSGIATTDRKSDSGSESDFDDEDWARLGGMGHTDSGSEGFNFKQESEKWITFIKDRVKKKFSTPFSIEDSEGLEMSLYYGEDNKNEKKKKEIVAQIIISIELGSYEKLILKKDPNSSLDIMYFVFAEQILNSVERELETAKKPPERKKIKRSRVIRGGERPAVQKKSVTDQTPAAAHTNKSPVDSEKSATLRKSEIFHKVQDPRPQVGKKSNSIFYFDLVDSNADSNVIETNSENQTPKPRP